MSKFPSVWTQVLISEVLDLNENGKPFQQGWSPQCHSHPAPEGSWGALKTTAIQHGEFWPHENKAIPDHLEPRPHIEVKPGDLLMTCAGPRNRCGVACLVERTPPRLMMSGKMYRFRPNQKVMHAKYLMYFLLTHSTTQKIDRMKTGISDSGLNLTHDRFATLEVPVAPPKEQFRIVAKIEELFSELDKGVESLTTAREQLKAYRQSVLKHAFCGKLSAKFRLNKADVLPNGKSFLARVIKERHDSARNAGRKEWDSGIEVDAEEAEATLGYLPLEWTWAALGQLAGHITDGTHKTPTYTSIGVPFISAKDIFDFRIHFDNTRFISQNEHVELSKRCAVRRHNVLITKSGTIGRVAVVATDSEFSLFESVACIPLSELVNSTFVSFACYFMIDSYYGARNQKGVAVRHLHLEDIRKLPIPLPSRSEQDEIVNSIDEMLSEADRMDCDIDIQLAKSSALRQSILKQAFSGQLVAQDPTDEPASVLLERIRAERKKADAKKPGRKTKSTGNGKTGKRATA